MLILMVRSATPTSLISKTFGPDKLNIPKAPALGLLLERPIFTQYNTRIAALEQSREPVDFDKYEVRSIIHQNFFPTFGNMTIC
jgi:tRNA pseudouridine38-40 synthase